MKNQGRKAQEAANNAARNHITNEMLSARRSCPVREDRLSRSEKVTRPRAEIESPRAMNAMGVQNPQVPKSQQKRCSRIQNHDSHL